MSLVLIVEDEEALLEVFAEVVEALGHRALRAHDGEMALTLARTEPPDLVVSDHMMPRRTGMELLRAMRAEPLLADIPFVLLSAARPAGREEADAFLAKPVDLATFEEAIHTALRSRLPSASLSAEGRASGATRTASGRVHEEMLQWVAHELKTPLSSARLNAQVLLRKLEKRGGEDESRSAAAVLRQLDRMSGLITSILDAGRLSGGKVELRPSYCDILPFLRELLQEWRELEPRVEFMLLAEGEPVTLSFDAERIRQVLNNLLSNAVKYCGEQRRVELGLSVSPGQAVIHVRDWGVGIPASELRTIFDRFQRADDDPARGHGLGLFIASQLARLHGGSLSVRSSLGEGSTFQLRLPLRR
ncbi:HAMP domain-containing histidine kinase [Pyxidicoccus fallax]|uniref:histidine kinase n=1 Tax=Pyxidicoccus fallax TaxID=394095 RepID=A0A848LJR5_9BACT|nr:HAMP domain-containing sensor histidine kinase [Pyxidicoccus fallax]NMO17938.1 HAMP domain-containing histidine kinase [Pyxidicoccus fallax]NPC80055.1 HAMP domain-containing histidine kinase [Pyxidicoccus fallax]